jgi:hypothetical protein
MSKDAQPNPLAEDLARELNEQMVLQFGPVLSFDVLVKALGYRSAEAYRKAVARDTVPVPLFQIPNRRGRFALARDVAIWLSQQRHPAEVSDSARPDPSLSPYPFPSSDP